MLLINNGQFVQLKCTNLSGSLGSYPELSGTHRSFHELSKALRNSSQGVEKQSCSKSQIDRADRRINALSNRSKPFELKRRKHAFALLAMAHNFR